MYIDTYINTNDNLDLHKNPTAVASSVTVLLKDDTTLKNPQIILSPGTSYFNYCYISEFGRYYFVTDRTYSQQRYIYTLEVDPWMSFQSNLEDVNVIAGRSSSRFDLYLPDPDLPVRADADIRICEFYNGFNSEGSEEFVLAVSGGYQNPTP